MDAAVTLARPRRWVVPAAIALVASALLLAGASPGDGAAAPERPDAGERAQAAAKKKRTKLRLIDTRFGRILADGKGFALYLFTRDQDEAPPSGKEKSRCYGNCAEAWPVLPRRGKLRAGKGVSSELLGTTRRRNGDRQVTYDGHPLYYYVGDTKPEKVFCQDVREFGGVWYVVTADGEAVL
jgi:predicted lipoprotein with Yx(FWY)xxD motif